VILSQQNAGKILTKETQENLHDGRAQGQVTLKESLTSSTLPASAEGQQQLAMNQVSGQRSAANFSTQKDKKSPERKLSSTERGRLTDEQTDPSTSKGGREGEVHLGRETPRPLATETMEIHRHPDPQLGQSPSRNTTVIRPHGRVYIGDSQTSNKWPDTFDNVQVGIQS